VSVRNTFLHYEVDEGGISDAPEQPVLWRSRTAPVGDGGRGSSRWEDEGCLGSCPSPAGVCDEEAKGDRPAAEKPLAPPSFGSAAPPVLEEEGQTAAAGAGCVGVQSSPTLLSHHRPGSTAQHVKSNLAAKKPDDDLRAAATEIADRAASCTPSKTTIMLRNLPNNYTRDGLLNLLASQGFGGKLDFLYFPIDFKTHAALGYAFVNLQSQSEAERLWLRFDGFSAWCIPSSKVCYVSWSQPLQGLAAHIARYRNSPLMHETVPDSYRPMLFSSGERVAFPPPTKRIKPPRKGNERMLV